MGICTGQLQGALLSQTQRPLAAQNMVLKWPHGSGYRQDGDASTQVPEPGVTGQPQACRPLHPALPGTPSQDMSVQTASSRPPQSFGHAHEAPTATHPLMSAGRAQGHARGQVARCSCQTPPTQSPRSSVPQLLGHAQCAPSFVQASPSRGVAAGPPVQGGTSSDQWPPTQRAVDSPRLPANLHSIGPTQGMPIGGRADGHVGTGAVSASAPGASSDGAVVSVSPSPGSTHPLVGSHSAGVAPAPVPHAESVANQPPDRSAIAIARVDEGAIRMECLEILRRADDVRKGRITRALEREIDA